MTFVSGYLTDREKRIWAFRRRSIRNSEIGRCLDISRQAVHSALSIIDSKVEKALMEAAEANMLEIRSLNLVDGVMEAYSPAHQIPVLVSLSNVNGLKIWYLYEGNCSRCSRVKTCRTMFEAEAMERGVALTKDDRSLPPTQLAVKIFSRYMVKV